MNSSPHGKWLSDDVAMNLPRARWEFDVNRDPLMRRQIEDLAKTEAQRRREQESGGEGTSGNGGRGSKMVKKDKPALNLKPPRNVASEVDRQTFKANWLAEQANAVMAKADIHRSREASPVRDSSHAFNVPSHGPSM